MCGGSRMEGNKNSRKKRNNVKFPTFKEGFVSPFFKPVIVYINLSWYLDSLGMITECDSFILK